MFNGGILNETRLTIQIISSGGTFSFLELLLPSEDIVSETTLFFLAWLNLLVFSSGFGFLGVSSSKEITKPLTASVSSFNLSVFILDKVSCSSSVKLGCPELDLSEDGPPDDAPSPPDPFRVCLKAEDIDGRLILVGDGEDSFILKMNSYVTNVKF